MKWDKLISERKWAEAQTPRHEVIAAEIEKIIRSGEVPPGEKLPTHRELARRIGVTTGIISRAYALLVKRGLLSARVGDGSYVRELERASEESEAREASAGMIDLSHNVAISTDEVAAMQATLSQLAQDTQGLMRAAQYQSESGSWRHRQAAGQWFSRFGLSSDPNRVMITHGAQHGLACVLRALVHPGDTILAESLTYPGLMAVAREMRIQVMGLEMDEEGIVPDVLRKAVGMFHAKVLFCSPTLHNPTTSSMGWIRRDEIARIALECKLVVIEDLVHAAIAREPLPALSAALPSNSFVLSSFSKVLAPGLRVGYIHAAPTWFPKVAHSMRADCWMAAPLLPEVITRWLEQGEIDRLIGLQRDAIHARLELLHQRLAGLHYLSSPDLPFVWLPLPEPWSTAQFSAVLRENGVQVRIADHFAAGRSQPAHAVRISVNAVASDAQLAQALDIVSSTVRRQHGIQPTDDSA